MFDNIKFERISGGSILDNGLTRCLNQDKDGFLWIGHDHCLARYDGYSFKIFQSDKSISDFCIDNSGNLILLTYYHGLVEFDIQKEIFSIIKIPFQLEGDFSSKIIMINDEIWIATLENGLFRYDRNSNQYENYRLENNCLNDNFISSIYYDEISNKLFIGTRIGGINMFDFYSNSFSSFMSINEERYLPGLRFISEMIRDSRGYFWISTVDGLFWFDNNLNFIEKFYTGDSPRSIAHRRVYSVCEDKNGTIWIGTEKGLNCYDFKNDEVRTFRYDRNNKDGIFFNLIRKVFCDRNNTIFFATEMSGIGKFDQEVKGFHYVKLKSNKPDNPAENHIYTIYKDLENNLWLGTYYGGFYRCTTDSQNGFITKEFTELEHEHITGITCDSSNRIWVSSTKGLCSINISDNSLKFIESSIFSKFMKIPFRFIAFLCPDKLNPNHIWLNVNDKSLLLFDTSNLQILNSEISTKLLTNLHVSCMYSDSKKRLWVGTNNSGLILYDYDAGTVQTYSNSSHDTKTVSDNKISSIVEDNKQNIWIGTGNGGFNKFIESEKTFERYSIKDGLLNAVVRNITFDENDCLWISVRGGLVKFNPMDRTFVNYFETSLLEGTNDYACHKSYDDTIYFGTNDGVVYFNPKEITTNPYIPNIEFTDFQIFNESIRPSPENPFLKKSISYAKEITLTHNESVITFEFAALIFNNPKKNQYAYKMEGFDEDWVYCGTRRTATYTNLDPGEYTFRVKGSNNDGLWNEEGTSIKVIITPPWYKTVLFKGLVGLSVIGSFGSFYRKRIQKLNKEKSQQEEFTKKLIESQENERKRVAAELHDSLGQDLLIIKNKLLTNIKKTDDVKYKEQFQEISELTSSTLDDVREISYNLRPYEIDRLGLTKTITSMIGRANGSTNIIFTGSIDDIDKLFLPEVEINIYRIIQESLNNVIKHSEAKEVIVSVLKKEKEITINISDDGKGFDVRKSRKGFGLKGIEERVRLLNGEFNIESDVGNGTTVKIQLTVDN